MGSVGDGASFFAGLVGGLGLGAILTAFAPENDE